MKIEIKNKINDLVFIKSILIYKLPLLNFFKNSENNIYLSYWYDLDEDYDKWALLLITGGNLEDYNNDKISLLNIFNENKSFLVFDTKHNNYNFEQNEWENLLEMKLEDFNCLPEKGTYSTLDERFNYDK